MELSKISLREIFRKIVDLRKFSNKQLMAIAFFVNFLLSVVVATWVKYFVYFGLPMSLISWIGLFICFLMSFGVGFVVFAIDLEIWEIVK